MIDNLFLMFESKNEDLLVYNMFEDYFEDERLYEVSFNPFN